MVTLNLLLLYLLKQLLLRHRTTKQYVDDRTVHRLTHDVRKNRARRTYKVNLQRSTYCFQNGNQYLLQPNQRMSSKVIPNWHITTTNWCNPNPTRTKSKCSHCPERSHITCVKNVKPRKHCNKDGCLNWFNPCARDCFCPFLCSQFTVSEYRSGKCNRTNKTTTNNSNK